MENALLFTGLLVLAATAGGVIGSACARKKNAPDVEGRLADLEDRLDALASHCMEQDHRIGHCERYDGESAQRIHELEERASESELLIGETPDEGLLGRVGALEEARRKEGPKLLDLEACVDAQGDRLEVLEGRFDTFEGGASLELTNLRAAVEKPEANNG